MGVLLEGDIGELYLDCVVAVEDEEYCSWAVRLVKEAKRHAFKYGATPRLYLRLPDVDYAVGTIVDQKKRQIIITMLYVNHAVFLYYVRDKDGFTLKTVDILNANVAAMYNGPPPP
jgi:hypothetical protein